MEKRRYCKVQQVYLKCNIEEKINTTVRPTLKQLRMKYVNDLKGDDDEGTIYIDELQQ